MNKLIKFIKNNLVFLLIILIGIALEIGYFSNVFFISAFQGLKETELSLANATFNDFSESNGKFISLSEDPNITFKQVDKRVRFISVDCRNSIPDALGQVFYKQAGQGFSEEDSLIYPLSDHEIVIELPKTLIIDRLRFDLTNQEGDSVVCDSLTINPRVGYRPYFLSYLFMGLGILGLIIGRNILPGKFYNKIWEFLVKNGLLFFLVLIIIIDFAYPPTITFDSAQYLFLSDLIKTGSWADWDPLRTIFFPLKILLSLHLFGYQTNALLLPIITSHLVLFIFCFLIIKDLFKPKTKLLELLILFSVFLIVILDPTVFGYYHVLLTEYLAATIAIISCYLAIRIYKARFFSKEFIVLSVLLVILVPIAWHIKQPYVGAALFPLVIVCLLIIFRHIAWKTIFFSVLTISTAAILVFLSNLAWDNFIENKNYSLDEDRLISSQISSSVDQNRIELSKNPGQFITDKLEDYFISINFRTQDTYENDPKFSLTEGFQNHLIAHRQYLNPRVTNMTYDHQPFDAFTKYFFARYQPPALLNYIFLTRLTLSHFLFTSTYLLLPLFVMFFSITWLFRKNLMNAVILILSATSLFNAMGHLIIWPIDRYLFLGYPLNLILLIILFLQWIRFNLSLFNCANFMPKESL